MSTKFLNGKKNGFRSMQTNQIVSIEKVLLFIVYVFILSVIGNSCTETQDLHWKNVDKILLKIIPPEFPNREFDITDYGAVGDGKTISTAAFQRAINDCNQAGGGKVVVPAGIYLTGAIHLKSNVNLYVSKNSTILFSKDLNDYLPIVHTRFEGVECMNYSPFIYVFEQENIAITGSGTLDGQAGEDNWWSWKGRDEYGWKDGQPNGLDESEALYQMAEEGIPINERIFGPGHELRTNFIQPYKCKNVLIDSIHVFRSPMWVIHPVLCENVTVQNVTVNSHGPNNDGCNPESSKNVLIQNCFFDTGDDCIAIKSGRNAEGRRINVSSENILIRNCTMRDGHGGVVIGSEMSGNVYNVYIEECHMDSPNLERALRIKTNSLRGGIVENVFMRNCQIGQVSDAILRVNFRYGQGDTGNFTPVVKNIYLKNLVSKKSRYAFYLDGYERSPITNIQVEDCRFDGVKEGNILNNYSGLVMKNTYINGKLQK